MTTKRAADLQLGDQVITPHEEVGTVIAAVTVSPGVYLVLARDLDAARFGTSEANLPADREVTVAPGFGCPRCLRVSHNPNDAQHRYCGACHIFWPTTPDVSFSA